MRLYRDLSSECRFIKRKTQHQPILGSVADATLTCSASNSSAISLTKTCVGDIPRVSIDNIHWISVVSSVSVSLRLGEVKSGREGVPLSRRFKVVYRTSNARAAARKLEN